MTPAQIIALRQQLGETQQGLAERVNQVDPLLRLDRNAVSRYERGTRHPSPHVAAALTQLWIAADLPLIHPSRP